MIDSYSGVWLMFDGRKWVPCAAPVPKRRPYRRDDVPPVRTKMALAFRKAFPL